MEDEKMLTVVEAAERLNVKPGTIAAAIRRGQLAAEKLARDWRIPESEVERYRSRKRGRPKR